MQDSITPFLPKEGVIAKFMEYTDAGEICYRFRCFACIAALGSCIQRKVIFRRNRFQLSPPIYPNPWVILVAPQGIGHKSSALRIAKSFLEHLPIEHRPRIMAAKLTPEALIKSLASQILTEKEEGAVHPGTVRILKRKAQGLLYSSEFGVLLGREKYNMGMIALLTDLYDCPDEWVSETIMRGDQRLYDVALNVMGASTPDWMQSMLPTDAFKGGFMSRLILVGYPENWNKRVADPEPRSSALREEIEDYFLKISKLKLEMSWTPEAREYFSNWYNALPEPEPGPKAAYLERKQDHIIKLAIIIQLSKLQLGDITYENIKQAHEILESVQPETLLMIDYISVEPRMRSVQRVLEYLRNGPATEASLLAETWRYLIRAGEFDEIISLLMRVKLIKTVVKDSEIVYSLREKDDEER